MKPRILITMPSLDIGGAERSLLALLRSIDIDYIDVDLLLLRHEGELMGLIPPGINLLPYNRCYSALETPVRALIKEKRFIFAALVTLARLSVFLESKVSGSPATIFHHRYYVGRFVVPLLPELPHKYAAAINFMGGNELILKRVGADIKLGWVHTDYSGYYNNKRLEEKIWKHWGKLDGIVFVSEDCTRVFKGLFPRLAHKCHTIENIISPEAIRRQSDCDVSGDLNIPADATLICSVGRLVSEKGFDVIPDVVRNLNSRGIRVQWLLVGAGPDEALIRSKISAAGLESQILLLGLKSNPYPYMRACDIYVQPSRREGKAVTVREAQILGRPVLITNYPTAHSQLANDVDGVIVERSPHAIAAGIQNLVSRPELRASLAAAAASAADGSVSLAHLYKISNLHFSHQNDGEERAT
jgi:glycosyltransferase involved in cell wall biosynthesis